MAQLWDSILHEEKVSRKTKHSQTSQESSLSLLFFAFLSSVPDVARSPSRFLGLYFVTKVGSSSRQRCK